MSSVNVQCVECYTVPHSNHYTTLHENISLYFVFISSTFIHFFLSTIPYSIPSFLNATTPLQCFYKGCIQSQQLDHRRLMHGLHGCSAIFPYQALERRPKQETNMSGGTLFQNKLKGVEHPPCVYRQIQNNLLLLVS